MWNLFFAMLSVAFLCFGPAIPQDQAFHRFADSRTFYGIPNFWNVMTNVPFVLVAIAAFRRELATPQRILFLGVLLTGFGSAWYHLVPNDAHLVWDRIPMTILFMAFLVCALPGKPDCRLLPVLVGLGIGSVLWWHFTGDLRPYALIKFGPILYLLPTLFKANASRYPLVVILLFGVAQVLEVTDVPIYAAVDFGGHALKHLTAGLATFVLYKWYSPASPSPASGDDPEKSQERDVRARDQDALCRLGHRAAPTQSA